MPWPIPSAIDLNGELYDLFEQRPGQRKWDTQEVPSQPGDGGKDAVYPLEFHAGFGASRRFLDGNGRLSDPGHHAYSENWQSHVKGLGAPAPRITYIDCSVGTTKRSTGFRFGGTKAGQFGGGSGPTSLGGGSVAGQIAVITEFGNYLYCSGGINTFTVNPAAATPSLVETKAHSDANSRGMSSDVFDNRLMVALGSDVRADTAASPYDGVSVTPWATAQAGVTMRVFRVGGGGRLFSAKDNLVFSVLPGVDPTLTASYLPTAGDEITDQTGHVHALAEYARGLVAAGHLTLHTFDPDAGYQPRALLPAVRTEYDEYHGRALIVVGELMFYASSRAVWLFVPGRTPQRVGPELLASNQTPYRGGQPGVPAFDGEALYWPYYFPNTGDSVIFRIMPRPEGEQGTGPFVWNEFLYLASRECRCVTYWGGDSVYKPRLFFGAGTSGSPQQVGWAQLGRGGAPDLFDSGSIPALSATLYGAIDDWGKPGVVREVVRLEFPSIQNTDASNYLVASISDDEGSTYKDLVKTNTGAANDNRITGTGFQQVFADVNTPSIPAGRWLQVKLAATQASGATTHLTYRGTPQLYVVERPATVERVTTLLHLEQRRGYPEDVETQLNRLKAHVGGAKVALKHAPGDTTVYVKVEDVRGIEVETYSDTGEHAGREVVAQITWREVATA